MPTYLTPSAVEKSTYVVTVAFTDETGVAVVPNSGLTWTLSDVYGLNIINSRLNVAITSASTIKIVLGNLDLAIGTNGRERVVTVQGTYNSSLGTNLPIKQEVRFLIENLVNVN